MLDLGARGLTLSGPDQSVLFDINGDGVLERIAWVAAGSEDGFLWLDLNRNGIVDDGGELFGDATLLPDGSRAANGFEALAAYDGPALGGDGDGVVSPYDAVWSGLRVWIDRDADAAVDEGEVASLDDLRNVGLDLRYRTIGKHDEHGNLLRYWGFFDFYDARDHLKRSKAYDVFFVSGD